MLNPGPPASTLALQIATIRIGQGIGMAVVLAVMDRLPEGGGHPQHRQAQQAHHAAPARLAQGIAMQQVVGGKQQHHDAVAHHQGKRQKQRQPRQRPAVQLLGQAPAQPQNRQVDQHQGQTIWIGAEGLRRQQRPQLAGVLLIFTHRGGPGGRARAGQAG